jgi:hypothetical protein
MAIGVLTNKKRMQGSGLQLQVEREIAELIDAQGLASLTLRKCREHIQEHLKLPAASEKDRRWLKRVVRDCIAKKLDCIAKNLAAGKTAPPAADGAIDKRTGPKSPKSPAAPKSKRQSISSDGTAATKASRRASSQESLPAEAVELDGSTRQLSAMELHDMRIDALERERLLAATESPEGSTQGSGKRKSSLAALLSDDELLPDGVTATPPLVPMPKKQRTSAFPGRAGRQAKAAAAKAVEAKAAEEVNSAKAKAVASSTVANSGAIKPAVATPARGLRGLREKRHSKAEEEVAAKLKAEKEAAEAAKLEAEEAAAKKAEAAAAKKEAAAAKKQAKAAEKQIHFRGPRAAAEAAMAAVAAKQQMRSPIVNRGRRALRAPSAGSGPSAATKPEAPSSTAGIQRCASPIPP